MGYRRRYTPSRDRSFKEKVEDLIDSIKDWYFHIHLDRNMIIIGMIMVIIIILMLMYVFSKDENRLKKGNTEKYYTEEQIEFLSKTEPQKRLKKFMQDIYEHGGYSSKNTYEELFKKLVEKYNFGKIEVEKKEIQVYAEKQKENPEITEASKTNKTKETNLENEEKVEEIINYERFLNSLDFSKEGIFRISSPKIKEGIYGIDDILFDNTEQGDEIKEYFKQEIKKIGEIKTPYEEGHLKKENTETINAANEEEILLSTEQLQNDLKSRNEVEIEFIADGKSISRVVQKKGLMPNIPEIPEVEGKVFVGWDRNPNTIITESTTFIAKFMEPEFLEGKIVCVFDLDGGKGTFPAQIVDEGKTLTQIIKESGLQTPIKEGHIFRGWSFDPNLKLTQNVIAKARWDKTQ